MYSIHANRNTYLGLFFLLIYLLSITPAAAIGEASTSLYVFVPPGGISSSHTASYLVITATQDNTFVKITDLDTTIGDPTNKSTPFTNSTAYPVVDNNDYDLSEEIRLNKGQSRIIKVSWMETGPDNDGTFFHIEADKQVITLSTTSEGQWQADFVPSINGTSKGKEFFVYLPSDKNTKGYDLAVFAYENDTSVTIYDISTDTSEMDEISDYNKTTIVNLSSTVKIANDVILDNETKPELFFEAENSSGVHAGHTYYVVASKPVTVQSAGTIGRNAHDARDGGYFIPGYSENPYRDGTGLASTFIAQLNLYDDTTGYYGETEVYLVNQNTIKTANVSIFEWNSTAWEEIPESPFTVKEFDIYIINENTTNYFSKTGLIKIISEDQDGNPLDISVFATSWLEVSGSFTADISSFTTGDTGYGGSKESIFYVPPPGEEPFFNYSRYSHIFIYIHFNNTDVEVQAWDNNASNWTTLNNGIYNNLEKNIVIDHRITWDQWKNSTNIDYHRMRVLSSERTTVQVNNWNDNWATYVPGGTPPDFSSKISIQSRYLTVNSIPVPIVSYSFNITNGAIGNIGSNLFNLSVTNNIPDGIDQRNFIWSVKSNMDGFEYNSLSYPDDLSVDTISNGTKYIWGNSTYGINATVFAYNNGSGTVFIFNKSIIKKNEKLNFNINTLLNSTYYNGNPIQSGVMVINVKAQAENPFLGKVTAYAKLPGTIILCYISPGIILLY
ncbi:MAG: hypothetical protein IMY70_01760 [Bacteroidetes bacterium]|nr:hypothetical protein [Bacteroidota bacterium]